MYDIKEVSQVNNKYIFFVFSDGTQDRKTVDINELKYLYNDVTEKMKMLDFTVKYNRDCYENAKQEVTILEKIIEGYEKYIEENKSDPMVRRGLHDVCYSLTATENKRNEISRESFGMSHVATKASDEYWRLYKLQKQIEAVFQDVKKLR